MRLATTPGPHQRPRGLKERHHQRLGAVLPLYSSLRWDTPHRFSTLSWDMHHHFNSRSWDTPHPFSNRSLDTPHHSNNPHWGTPRRCTNHQCHRTRYYRLGWGIQTRHSTYHNRTRRGLRGSRSEQREGIRVQDQTGWARSGTMMHSWRLKELRRPSCQHQTAALPGRSRACAQTGDGASSRMMQHTDQKTRRGRASERPTEPSDERQRKL